MNVTKTTRIHSLTLALSFPLVLMLFAYAECAQAGQKSSDELLLEIMDSHIELITNEIFLAQAKLLGAYVEAAQELEEAKKIKVYEKVLNILTKIKNSPIKIKEIADESESVAEQKPLEAEKQKAKSVYEPGAALLEIFKLTGNETSLENIPELPIIRTYWKSGLACSADFLLPERLEEVGEGSAYVGKFSFYYEAKQTGKYGFTIQHNRNNACVLKIGGSNIVEAVPKKRGFWSSESGSVQQGLCNLKKGFHRVEFWLVSLARSMPHINPPGSAVFQAKILTPDAFDAVPITKDMMLLKKE